ncbi:MAG TPA: phenylalanine--tRNA ligase subunit beta [Sutterella sp.]|nr:phenylalanine--tRNA ligase subunit beta [Sutterella sp.]
MLFAESWLRAYINPDMDTEALCLALTMQGLEVEEVNPIAPPFTGVVVGRVLTCVDHENSDHLHVTTVDVGDAEPLQIVCGAPNVRAGIKVACARIGAQLPGGFKIGKAKMRGVESFGMLCSQRELGITDNHDGIWILPEDAPVGTDVREVMRLDDQRIEIKLTPNRGDALSVVGVARDLHAATGAALTLPVFKPVPATCDDVLPVHVESTELCGRFTGRVIRGLNAKAATPAWMRDRLERAGQRSISALVDISNYVMLELGRPTHFYDLAKFDGDMYVRFAKSGEKVTLLNGNEVALDDYFGVIASESGPEGLAGIMGGEKTAISLDTKDIFIEAAFWLPEQIQGRARRLNFSTDAAHRFERGVDYGSNADHVEYITQLVLDICATPETRVGPLKDQILNTPGRVTVKMRADRARKVIGEHISNEEMAACFTKLGFVFTEDAGVFTVEVPTFRFDIRIEEDLIEEVARIYGYERLPALPPKSYAFMRSAPEAKRTLHEMRRKLADMGYQELINFSFVPRDWEVDFAANEMPIELLNPIASQLSVMRTQLIGGLIQTLKFNLNRKAEGAKLFEIGRVFTRDDTIQTTETSVKGIRQPVTIAGLSYGIADGEQWGNTARRVDFYDAKGDLENLLEGIDFKLVAKPHPALHPGRSAAIVIDGKEVGFIGEIHPKWLFKYELPAPAVVFSIEAEPALAYRVTSSVVPPKLQPVMRDISVVVPKGVTYERVMREIAGAVVSDPTLSPIEEVRLFDMYTGHDNVTSMAFHIRIQPTAEDFRSEDADELVQRIVTALGAIGLTLRQ